MSSGSNEHSRPRVKLHLGYAAAAVGYVLGVALLASSPEKGSGAGRMFSLGDLLQVPLFAGVAACLLLAVTGGQWARRVPWRIYVTIAVLAGGYAVFDEWRQLFMPGAHASLADFLLKCTGIAALVLIHRLAAQGVGETVRGDSPVLDRSAGPRGNVRSVVAPHGEESR